MFLSLFLSCGELGHVEGAQAHSGVYIEGASHYSAAAEDAPISMQVAAVQVDMKPLEAMQVDMNQAMSHAQCISVFLADRKASQEGDWNQPSMEEYAALGCEPLFAVSSPRQ
jgi:hypothetical protein